MNHLPKPRSVWIRRSLFVLGGLLLLPAMVAHAQEQKPRIELKTSGAREVVRDNHGKKVVELLPASEAGSGETLVYTTEYHNSGQGSAKEVTVVSPIPANTVYVDGSAAGRNCKILYSLNQGATFHEPPLYVKTRDPAGREISVPATPEQITKIKWIVQTPVKAGERGTTTYKVRIK